MTVLVKVGLYPANTSRWPNVGLMLGQRRRRWANIKPTLGQHLVFEGLNSNCGCIPRSYLGAKSQEHHLGSLRPTLSYTRFIIISLHLSFLMTISGRIKPLYIWITPCLVPTVTPIRTGALSVTKKYNKDNSVCNEIKREKETKIN